MSSAILTFMLQKIKRFCNISKVTFILG